jgi:hypothetical protein
MTDEKPFVPFRPTPRDFPMPPLFPLGCVSN